MEKVQRASNLARGEWATGYAIWLRGSTGAPVYVSQPDRLAMDSGRLRRRGDDPDGARDGRRHCSPTSRSSIVATANLRRQTFAARSTRTSRVGSGSLIGWMPGGRATIGGDFVVIEVGIIGAAARVGSR